MAVRRRPRRSSPRPRCRRSPRLQPGLLEQPVEHAPGEGAVRPAALQRQIDQQRIPVGPDPDWSWQHISPVERHVAPCCGCKTAPPARNPRTTRYLHPRCQPSALPVSPADRPVLCRGARRRQTGEVGHVRAPKGQGRAAAVAPAEPRRPPPPPRRGGLAGGLGAAWRSFSGLGLVLGAIFLALSLTPSLIPRSFPLQGVLAGVSMAVGYGLGVLVGALWSYLELPLAARPNPPLADLARRRRRRGGSSWSYAWRAAEWQNSIRRVVDMPPVETGARPDRGDPARRRGGLRPLACSLARFFRGVFRIVGAPDRRATSRSGSPAGRRHCRPPWCSSCPDRRWRVDARASSVSPSARSRPSTR